MLATRPGLGADQANAIREIAASRAAVSVLVGPAGTGKTYTITSLLVRLVAEGRLNIEQVLAVTFTNAAAAELEGRIRERVTAVRAAVRAGENGGDEVAAHLLRLPDREEIQRRLERAVRDIDRAAVTTIHGFCARALSEYCRGAHGYTATFTGPSPWRLRSSARAESQSR